MKQKQIVMVSRLLVICLFQVLTKLGYTLSLEKCSLISLTFVRFLGFLVESVRQAYILPDDKRKKFVILRERECILKSEIVGVKTMQRFTGKCIAMGFDVSGENVLPGGKNAAISRI